MGDRDLGLVRVEEVQKPPEARMGGGAGGMPILLENNLRVDKKKKVCLQAIHEPMELLFCYRTVLHSQKCGNTFFAGKRV